MTPKDAEPAAAIGQELPAADDGGGSQVIDKDLQDLLIKCRQLNLGWNKLNKQRVEDEKKLAQVDVILKKDAQLFEKMSKEIKDQTELLKELSTQLKQIPVLNSRIVQLEEKYTKQTILLSKRETELDDLKIKSKEDIKKLTNSFQTEHEQMRKLFQDNSSSRAKEADQYSKSLEKKLHREMESFKEKLKEQEEKFNKEKSNWERETDRIKKCLYEEQKKVIFLTNRNRSVTPNGDWFNPSGLIPGEQPFDPKQQQGHNQPNLAYNQQDFTYNQQRQGFNQSDVGYNRNYNQKSGGYNQPRSSYNQNVLDFNNQQYLGSNTWNRNIPNQSTTGHASSMYNPQEPKINAYSSATTTASLRGSIASTMSSLVGQQNVASSKSGNGPSYSRPGQLATFPTLGDNLNEHLNDTTKSSMNNKADFNKSSEHNTKQLFEESKKSLEEYKLGIAKGINEGKSNEANDAKVAINTEGSNGNHKDDYEAPNFESNENEASTKKQLSSILKKSDGEKKEKRSVTFNLPELHDEEKEDASDNDAKGFASVLKIFGSTPKKLKRKKMNTPGTPTSMNPSHSIGDRTKSNKTPYKQPPTAFAHSASLQSGFQFNYPYAEGSHQDRNKRKLEFGFGQNTSSDFQKPDCEEKENKPRLETLQTAANQAGQFRLKPSNHQAQEVSWGLGAQQDHEESRNQYDTGNSTDYETHPRKRFKFVFKPTTVNSGGGVEQNNINQKHKYEQGSSGIDDLTGKDPLVPASSAAGSGEGTTVKSRHKLLRKLYTEPTPFMELN